MTKYPVLSAASGTARVSGWILIVVGAIVIFWGAIELTGPHAQPVAEQQTPFGIQAPSGQLGPFGVPLTPDAAEQLALAKSWAKLFGGATAIVYGFILLVTGEAIRVVIDIERNTALAAGVRNTVAAQSES